MGEHDKAVKVHLQFDPLRSVHVASALTDGSGDERVVLKEQLQPGNLYSVYCGYLDYGLNQSILDAQSSFLACLRGNCAREVVEARALAPAARATGVVSNQVVGIGDERSSTHIQKPLRLVQVHVVNAKQNGLKPRRPRVSRKVISVRVQASEFEV
ncbi:MAG: hypothetical protein HS116_06040 [Planctomycetes bacterium]|nr:hypothetical protein [Planctomycetota bacterium]